MILRAPVEADAAAICGLLSELGYPTNEQAVTQRLAKLSSHPDHILVVAGHEKALLGLGVAHVIDVFHTDGPVTLITALVVAQSARSKGVGRAIAERLEEFARARGCPRIMVTTANHRADAHTFYERLGFAFTGRRYVKAFDT